MSSILLTAFFVFDNTSFGGNINTIAWVNNAIGVSALMIIFNRFGIVAFISAYFFGISIVALLLSFDPANIVFPQTVATLVIYFAIMGYSAYISIGEAKLFGEKSWLGD